MKKEKVEQAGMPKRKKGKKKWIVLAIVVIIILIAAVGGSGGTETGSTETPTYTMEFGDLVEYNENEIDGKDVLVVKAKITSSYNNNATVEQNYYNVEDLIQNQGCDVFDELQYWAVADMSSGDESKVISFTVDSELIQHIAAGDVVANELGDYADDLYIHPSLSE